ncbi:hypothetical protein DPMN_148530 [Dreissena polymorpha]|uniref:Uncharacterized protein n=1 Tax=Dreissena polymorpha TaxID=45954 RepID=A0A9D4FFP5_DREPO|nr:hypothetical protein DPMN_148530 [Dreissena polymorpha]
MLTSKTLLVFDFMEYEGIHAAWSYVFLFHEDKKGKNLILIVENVFVTTITSTLPPSPSLNFMTKAEWVFIKYRLVIAIVWGGEDLRVREGRARRPSIKA